MTYQKVQGSIDTLTVTELTASYHTASPSLKSENATRFYKKVTFSLSTSWRHVGGGEA